LLNKDISLVGTLRAQKALNGKNLDGTEQLSISGLNGVKAYPDSEYSADNGYVIGLEADYRLPEIIGITHHLGVFFDNGRGKIEDDGYTTAKSRTLSNMGLLYAVKYKSFFLKTQAARTIGGENVESERDYETRFLCQTGVIF
jgi:hemolysin activation/secretion protein